MLNARLAISCCCLTLLISIGLGCRSKYDAIPTYQPATQPLSATGLSDLVPFTPVDAIVDPPVGWKPDELKTSDQHSHQAWLSPTGKTAYGVIHFGLPLPVPATWILGPFLSEMKKSEGEATLIGSPLKDDALPGVRFTVEGGDYKMRVNLICKGFRAWAVYAGTLRKEQEVPAELELAERARDKTQVGVAGPTSQGPPTFTRPTASIAE